MLNNGTDLIISKQVESKRITLSYESKSENVTIPGLTATAYRTKSEPILPEKQLTEQINTE